MQPFLALISPLTGPLSDAHPAHPIVIPPPGNGGQPPVSGPPPHVEHPIPPTIWPNPPEGGGSNPPSGPIPLDMQWHTVWSAEFGWALVGVPQGPHPTPSAAPAPAKK